LLRLTLANKVFLYFEKKNAVRHDGSSHATSLI